MNGRSLGGNAIGAYITIIGSLAPELPENFREMEPLFLSSDLWLPRRSVS